jgi:hypothetical protein
MPAPARDATRHHPERHDERDEGRHEDEEDDPGEDVETGHLFLHA